jgi:hypothetical protein
MDTNQQTNKMITELELKNARELVLKEKMARSQRVKERVDKILEEENCVMDVMNKLEGNTISSYIVFIPKDN